MDRFEAMGVLVAVAEQGSQSAAGRRLGVPLSSVSRKIADLEAHLGTLLLTRAGRRATLTEAGRAYVVACKRILEDVGEAERSAAGEYRTPRGELTVTAPLVFGRLHMLPVVLDFLAAFPEVDVRLSLVDRRLQLVEDHVDLALRIGPLADSSLVALKVGTMRRVVVASPDYLARRGIPRSPAELSGHDCIDAQGARPTSDWAFETRIPVRSRLDVNTAEAAIDAAAAGIGLARVLYYQAVAGLREGRLTLVLEQFEPEPWPVSLVHTGQGLLPLKLRAFIDFAAPALRKRLAAL
jgi:DNA-binding transcriptional LysR family regulator